MQQGSDFRSDMGVYPCSSLVITIPNCQRAASQWYVSAAADICSQRNLTRARRQTMSAPSSAIESVLVENRVFPPSEATQQAARISGMAAYEAQCDEAQRDYEGYWARLAHENVVWSKPGESGKSPTK